MTNPLADISAAVQVLAIGFAPGDPRRAIFEEIGAEVWRVDQTVIDLLRFSRPFPPRRRPTSLRPLARFIIESRRRAHPSTELALDVPEDLVVALYERMIEQVLENLVCNALPSIEGRSTRVCAVERADGGGLALEVRDGGPGIPPNRRENMFELFYTTNDAWHGTGLSIARKNAEAHGGSLESDDAPEGGARFTVRLPEPRETA